ncbi:MAG: GNAT family N-acetyltransferase [Negativicutes bacterium]|nr:GNAT family N-acetyltransferase [Negativicutes bacterium]
MRQYRFDEMKEEYLDEVLAIYSYYVLHTTATFHDRVLTAGEMREIVFFDSPRYKTFVIFDDGSLCGYVFIARHKNREAYDSTAEVSVYLRPGLGGRGIGSLAIKHIEEYARSQRLHALIATICGQNGESIRLFAKNGYRQCAHYLEVGRKFGQLLDVVAYQKILD